MGRGSGRILLVGALQTFEFCFELQVRMVVIIRFMLADWKA